MMSRLLRQISEHSIFQAIVIAAILVAGVTVGLQSDTDIEHRYGHWLEALDSLILTLFTIEILIKIGAEGQRPWRYFQQGWNVFDFVIVAVCYLPLEGGFLTILRLARLLRIVRLVHFLPKLQVLVNAMLKSMPSMGYVSLLLGLVFYVYAVMGVFLFSDNDPVHFDDLGTALLTLVRLVTLEDWTDVMYTQIHGCAIVGYGMNEELCTHSNGRPFVATIYFVSFVLLGTMVLLNLFIGVIMSSMEEARSESGVPSRDHQLNRIVEELESLRAKLDEVGHRH